MYILKNQYDMYLKGTLPVEFTFNSEFAKKYHSVECAFAEFCSIYELGLNSFFLQVI